MFWLGLVLPLSYIPAVTDLDILSGWIVLSLALPFFFLRPLQLGIAHYLGLAFLGYAFLSLLWAPVWQQGVWDIWQLAILAGCFCLGSSRDDLTPLYKGLAIGIGINTALAICQKLGWQPVYHNNSSYPAGLFFNPDMLGESAALVSVALVSTRAYRLLGLTVPAVFLSGGRTAILTLGIITALEGWKRWPKATASIALAILTFVWIDNHTTSSLVERWDLWQDTYSGLSWFGHGAGSFFMLYPQFAAHTDTMLTRPEDPHNDYLGFLFQYGLGSLPVGAIFCLGLASSSPKRILLFAYCLISFFSFPMRIPIEGLLGMVALGVCLRDCPLDGWVGRRLRPLRDARAGWDGRKVIPLEPLYSGKAGL